MVLQRVCRRALDFVWVAKKQSGGSIAANFGHRARCIHHNMTISSAMSTHGHKRLQESTLTVQSAVPLGPYSAKVIFSDEQTCDFKFIWLRDNCPCASCVHLETKQKLLDTPALNVNLRPQALMVTERGELVIDWPSMITTYPRGDPHRSVYDPSWLHKHGQCFVRDSFEVGLEGSNQRPPLEFWDRTIIWNRFPEISYREVMDSDEGLKTWLELIHRYGMAVMRGVPPCSEEVIKVVNRFAYVKETSYGLTFDVLSEPDPSAHLAYTGLRLELHTDMNYREKSPGLQLLHCLKASDPEQGGKSFFVDGFHAAKWLQENQPAAFHVLSSTPIVFSITTKSLKYSQHWPLICVDKDGDVTEIHYNNRTMGPLQAPSHLVMAFYHAYKLFTDKLRDQSLGLGLQLVPGDLVAFNNRRVLHGRSSFDPRKVLRHLQGCYVDIDEAMSRYDMLLSK